MQLDVGGDQGGPPTNKALVLDSYDIKNHDQLLIPYKELITHAHANDKICTNSQAEYVLVTHVHKIDTFLTFFTIQTQVFQCIQSTLQYLTLGRLKLNVCFASENFGN